MGRVLAVVTGAAIIGLAGCSSGSSKGSASGARPAMGDAGIQAVDVVARAGTFSHPLDAIPSADGSVIFFVASSGGVPVVLQSSGSGGAVTTVASGAPLSQPTGLSLSSDGNHLYVADQMGGSGKGAIFTVPTSSVQTPVAVEGTEGWAPRGLDVVNQGAADLIYFTGTDPASGKPGLFQVPAGGGTVSALAEGAPLVSPDSVVVAAQGASYVTDQAAGTQSGQVFKVVGGTVTSVLNGIDLGSPAGVTLINKDATLLLSSIAANGSDQVLFLDLATGKTAAATKVIGANKNSSGGLHRASGASVAAWADTQGTVYRVRFPLAT